MKKRKRIPIQIVSTTDAGTPDETFLTSDAALVLGGFWDADDKIIIGKRTIRSVHDAITTEIRPELERRAAEGEDIKVDPIVADLEELAGSANAGYLRFKEQMSVYITADRELTAAIRKLRVEQHYSWRAVARWASVHPKLWRFASTWGPPANQLAGMALCAIAADSYGEQCDLEPWNWLPKSRHAP